MSMRSIRRAVGLMLTALLAFSMLCITASAQKVVDPDRLGLITIHKQCMESQTEETPLPGVTYRYLKVADVVQYTKRTDDGDVVKIGYVLDEETKEFLHLTEADADYQLGDAHCYEVRVLEDALSRISCNGIEAYMKERNAPSSTPTDAQGQTVIEVPVGLYLICEYSYPANVITDDLYCAPFFISMPGTMVDENGAFYWSYQVETRPKNLLMTVRNDKVIVAPDGNETKELDAEIGEAIAFRIRSDIPQEVGKLRTYQIIDELSEGITINMDSVVVYGIAGADMHVILMEGVEFDLTVDGGRLCWDFNTQAIADDENQARYESIVIEYVARLNEKAIVGRDGNANELKTVYSRLTNVEAEDETVTIQPEEQPRLYTYALRVHKVAADTRAPMAGVVFELRDEAGNPVSLAQDEAGNYYLDSEGSAELVTNSDGYLFIKGLDAGCYALRELSTNNPLYSLFAEEVRIEIESNACSYIASESGTYVSVDPTKDYYFATFPMSNRFVLPEGIDTGTFIHFGADSVLLLPDYTEVETYQMEPLAWSANYAMGGKDSEDSGVVSVEVMNYRVNLPATGGDGDFVDMVLGGCIVAVGLSLFALTFLRRKKHSTKN